MKMHKGLIIAAVFIASAANCFPQEQPKDAELNESTYEIWRDHVLPRSWELKYQQIGWRTSYWDAVIEAQEKDKPILFWAMNGHPLCNV